MGELSDKTYAMKELEALTGFASRTVRHYVTLHLLAPPRYAGPATRYSRETLGRLSVIRTWRRDEKISIPAIKRALRELSEGELEAWAEDLDPLAPKVVTPAAPAPAPAPTPTPTVVARPDAEGPLGARWIQVTLGPEMYLMVKEGAAGAVEAAAREIRARYGEK